ncbi:unnamed protein product (macronuclear) [Paramecium tetraurelia]|uniref:RING-type domain-containing protein n=1 Tax=Paramecium tetraurelia TaxID=5888 RepID=A0DVA5_PARTE|nr:uncharacterized protein GSPATT00020636001 [Paramecium tetraurelia]CAK86972.1 unnamed protein product [Paramecium tetraurelia]|eukprot:XP_001454369.1 hypothetical protein (macronuclear) [Paramecium tetraurelia strain d4-2]
MNTLQPPQPQIQQNQQPQQILQYPNYPPSENQVRYDPRTAATFLNPKSIQKKAKFCPICDFPASVRVVINPCRHFMCYECYYIDGQTFCKFCNDIVGSVKRLDDTEKFYSCDLDTCFKYFESEQQLDEHNTQHAIILG